MRISDWSSDVCSSDLQISYVQDWAADRSVADIIAQQKVDLLKRVAAINRKQQEFRNVADQFGIEWRKEAKAGDAREKEAVAAVMARLDKLEAEAQAKDEPGTVKQKAQ